jgi:hypothetical protein
MTILVKGPDGSSVQFPDGTDHAVIDGVMAKHFPAPASTNPGFDDRFNAVSDEAAFRAVTPGKKPFTLADTLPGRIAQSIYSAVTLPGDVLAGKAHVPGSEDAQAIPGAVPFGSPDSSGERIAELAALGSPLSVASGSGKLIAAEAGLAKPEVVPSAPVAVPSIDQLKGAASAGYQSPEVANLAIKSPAINNFSVTAQTALNDAGIDANLAPKTFGILANLQKAPEAAVVTGKNIQSLRRMFGHAASSTDPTERLAANNAIEALDTFLPNVAKGDVISGDMEAAAKTLEVARGNFSAAMHAETIDNKAIQAELRAAAANSGTNVANTVRQRMADILLKPAEQRGFTKEELATMEKIVRGTPGQNILRAGGNLLGGGGGLGSAVVGGIGGLATTGIGGVGALAPVIGYTLKAITNKMTLKQADKLSEMIRSRAPLAKSMQDYEQSAAAAAESKTPGAMTALVGAAQNFSNNLKSAGFNVSATDLVRHSN